MSHVQKTFRGIQDIKSFRQSLFRRDRSSCGLLPVSEFQAVCASHGTSLTLPSLAPLLEDDAFSDQGNIRWKQIVDLLLETEKEKKSTEQKQTAASVPEVKEDAVEKQKDSIIDEEDEEGLGHGGPLQSKTRLPSGVACRMNAAPWDFRPLSEPAIHLYEPHRSDKEEEAWIDRFMKLETVLELCQIQDTGLVDAERAKQVINKYNVIYNLCLSPEKISEAIDKFQVGAHILLGPTLDFLKEL
ncbi:uncharacterized protein C1orf87 homolog isoform X2 [Dendropsophus ebraccatus]